MATGAFFSVIFILIYVSPFCSEADWNIGWDSSLCF